MKTHVDCLNEYKSCLAQWDKLSSIRSRPRRLLLSISENEEGYFYPLERQPIAIHPLVKARGKDVLKKLLIHSAYKFMLDIAYVEVEMINNTALKVYNGTIDYSYPSSLKQDMLTVIIDEAYHAYVALDYVAQIQNETGVKPFYQTDTVELEYYMKRYSQMLKPEERSAFEIIAICIGENTLTKELFRMTKQPELNPFFHQVISDHMIDEGRHSSLFRLILRKTWVELPEAHRLEIGAILPNFIIDYTSDTLHNRFNESLLKHLGFCSDNIDTIIRETRNISKQEELIKVNPVIHNLVDMMNFVGITLHGPTRENFKVAGLLGERM